MPGASTIKLGVSGFILDVRIIGTEMHKFRVGRIDFNVQESQVRFVATRVELVETVRLRRHLFTELLFLVGRGIQQFASDLHETCMRLRLYRKDTL